MENRDEEIQTSRKPVLQDFMCHKITVSYKELSTWGLIQNDFKPIADFIELSVQLN